MNCKRKDIELNSSFVTILDITNIDELHQVFVCASDSNVTRVALGSAVAVWADPVLWETPESLCSELQPLSDGPFWKEQPFQVIHSRLVVMSFPHLTVHLVRVSRIGSRQKYEALALPLPQ